MKKIIFITVLLCGSLFAQTDWTKYDKVEGRYSKHVKGDSSAVNVFVMEDASFWGTPKTTLEGMFSAMSYPTELYGKTDTVSVSVDTTTFTGHDSYIKVTVQADDSVEVSIVGSFPSGHTWIITTTTPVPIEWAINQTQTKLYIRRYGSAGTPRFYLRASAL